jgi:circadian clock protein KaiC
MSDDDDRVPARLERAPSGVPGLDAVLNGGFFRGSVYLLHAEPGSGKTVLGNQVCFRHVAAGGRAVVVTLLTESHTRLLAQLGSMTFFDPSVVGSSLSYVSGYEALESERYKGLLALIRKAVRDQKATLLLIDGVVTASALAESELETKRFIYELQAFAELTGCTTLLLTGASEPAEQYAFHTMVDGLIGLRLDAVGMEAVRTLEVTKFRGGPMLMGRHFFEITDAGVTVHPRAEARLGRSIDRPPGVAGHRAKFGISGLDAMLDGGLRSGSITLTIGTPGSGKTLAGLSFLAAGARQREPGAYFGFFETPGDLERKARAIGLSLAEHVESGLVDMMWQSPLDGIADALAERILGSIRERGVRRLFIDGLGGLRESLVYPARSRRFFTALFDELRALGVVTLLSDETTSLGALELPESGLTAALDNVIVLRQVELRGQLRKLASVVKMRGGDSDPTVREFSIGSKGFVVKGAKPAKRPRRP